MKRSYFIVIGLMLVTLIALSSYVFYAHYSKSAKERDSDAAKALLNHEGYSFIDMSGNPINLSMYKGKVLVVNSWASWCPFCKDEIPLLGKVVGELQDSNVVMLAINRAEPTYTITYYIEFMGNPEHVVFIQDPDDVFYKTAEGYAMPETLFYSKSGVLTGHHRGSLTEEQLKSYIDSAKSHE